MSTIPDAMLPAALNVAARLSAVLERSVDEKVSAVDAISMALGWAVGTTMRQFAWSPEQVAEEVLKLAREIQRLDAAHGDVGESS